jgi:hypothetical protein
MILGMLRGVSVLLVLTIGAQAQGEFPFGQELILEERPLPGSRQRPILNIGANGEAEIDLWCYSGTGRIAVAGSTISIAFGNFAQGQGRCTPERIQADEQLAAELAQVTAWRREDADMIVLIGARSIRFRQSAH